MAFLNYILYMTLLLRENRHKLSQFKYMYIFKIIVNNSHKPIGKNAH